MPLNKKLFQSSILAIKGKLYNQEKIVFEFNLRTFDSRYNPGVDSKN